MEPNPTGKGKSEELRKSPLLRVLHGLVDNENNIGGFLLACPADADPGVFEAIKEGLEFHHDHPECMKNVRATIDGLNEELGREAWKIIPLAVAPA
jgi:hypothetical protein